MKMGICTIRLDDITPDMNWDKFILIKGIFDKYSIKPLLGVVPDNQDASLQVGQVKEDFWSYLQELQLEGWSIAQHGYQHLYETKDDGLLGINPFSEFAGLPFEDQIVKLKKGKEILQKRGIHATIFMAPGHTYDANTLDALRVVGFTHVTDGYSSYPYISKGICFVPCTLTKPRIPKGVDTICLHINSMNQSDFNELDRFFEKHIGIIKNFSELLDVKYFKEKTFFVALEEKLNLWQRKIKNFAATNPVMQDYLVKTDYKNGKKKLWKRIIGLPGVCLRLLFHKGQ